MRLTYVAVLVFIMVGSGWLEIVMRTRVFTRWRRLVATLVPIAVIFCCWDGYAVATGQWTFAVDRVLGVEVAGLPLEEIAFFLVVPIAAVLTLEAVRSARGWRVGDEQVAGELTCVDDLGSADP